MIKKYDIENLEPKGVLKWFKKICSIPHGSFHEEKLSKFLQKELLKNNCKIKQFKTGAFLASKKATKGLEKLPCIMLQAHLDMVLVHDESLKIDLKTTPIKPYYEKETNLIKAEGTTLGADNGIGIAMIMEILTNSSIQHGPIECLCTTGEEENSDICMKTIPNGIFKAKQIINLDSENDEEICIGSGACRTLKLNHKIHFFQTKNGSKTYEIKLCNFKGGHSGIEIHKPHINVFKLIAKTLFLFSKKNNFNIVSWNGGDADNCIPKNSSLFLQLLPNQVSNLKKVFKTQLDIEKNICQGNDNDATVKISLANKQSKIALSFEESLKIVKMIALIPNGLFTYCKRGKCMFNSSNLGIISITNNKLEIHILVRSLLDADATQIIDQMAEYFKLFDIKNNEIKINYNDCFAWLVLNPSKSTLIQTWRKNFIKVYKKEPLIMPTPGGLEIASIIKKSPILEVNSLSCGPKISNPHTVNENCFVPSINKIWTILLNTLKDIK